MIDAIIFTAIYFVSAILVAIYFKTDKGEKDVSALIPILTPMLNTLLVIIGFVALMVGGILWVLERFPLTRLLLRWLNNGKEYDSFT